jgi:hypothetical protein
MAVGTDGRYYAEAEIPNTKSGKEAKEKFAALAEKAQEKAPKSDPEVVEAPVPDGSPAVRDNAGSTVPLTGDNVNPKTASKK